MRRTLYISGCEKSCGITTNFFNVNTECTVFIVIRHTKKLFCSFGSNLFETAKCLVRVTAFPTVQKWGEFCAMIYYDYCQGKFFQQCFQSLSGCFVNHSPSWSAVHKWYKELQFCRMMFEDRTIVANQWPLLLNKQGQDEVSDQRRLTNNRKWDKSFNLSWGNLNQILCHHLGVWKHCAHWVPHQLTKEQRKGMVNWWLHMLQTFDGGRSEWVWDIATGNKTFVYQLDPETKQQSSVWFFPG